MTALNITDSIRISAPFQTDSIVDGKGMRGVIWTQGCPHHCAGCHNPDTHDCKGGTLVSLEEMKLKIQTNLYLDGITFSGGEPFMQIEACTELADYARSLGMNIWCYTGFTWEQLQKLPGAELFLNEIDVLVDGPFLLSERSLSIPFRGSKNQRLIDVQESLKKNQVLLYSI